MEKDNPINHQPLFSNNPIDRSAENLPEEIIETPQEIEPQSTPKSHKDTPKSTRYSRVNTALLKLTGKERTIVKALTQGKEDKEALKIAGYSPSYIKNEGKKLIEKPVIQSTLNIIMENSGITDEFMMGRLKEGMDAKKQIAIKDLDEGEKTVIEVDDLGMRHKYLETGLKLKGHMDKKVDIVHHTSHEDQLRELQGGEIIDADYDEILPDT